MRYARKFFCMLLSALMAVGALSGCAEKEEDGAAERFTLRANVCGTIESLDPAMNGDARAESVFYALYENLLRLETDGEGGLALLPGVAKEYELVENYDGTVDYVFTLRSTARWSDGARVKARDFVYAWRRLADPATGSPNHALLSMVQGYDAVRETGETARLAVKAEGDSTFRVTLTAPCAYFLSETCAAVPTMPLRSDASSKTPGWATTVTALCDGPYQVGAWSKDDYIQLRRNSSYYDNRAVGPDILRFQFYTGAEAWRLYEAGRMDYIADPPAWGAATGGVSLRSTCCVFYNHVSDLFSNEHVRRAFDLVLDRAALAEAAGAACAPATGLVPRGVVDASAESEKDFRAAGGALVAVDAAGYSMRCLDAESELRLGGYWGGVGFPAASMLYILGGAEHAAAVAAAANWEAQLHVTVVLEGVTREEFDRRVADGEYELAIDTLSIAYGDAMEFLAPFAGTDGRNALHYVSTPFDLLIGVAGSSRDPAARAAFLHDAESLLLGDAALSPLYFGGATYALRNGLAGARHDARGNVYLAGVTRPEAGE